MENVRLVFENDLITSMEILNEKKFLEDDCKNRHLPSIVNYLLFYQDGKMIGKNESLYDPLILEERLPDGIYFALDINSCKYLGIDQYTWYMVIKKNNKIYQYDEIIDESDSYKIILIDNKIILDGQEPQEDIKIVFRPESSFSYKEIKKVFSLNTLLDCYHGFPYHDGKWENKNLFLEYILGKDFRRIVTNNYDAFIVKKHGGNNIHFDELCKKSYESLVEEFHIEREELFSKSFDIFYNDKMIILFSNGDIFSNVEYESLDLDFQYEEIIFCMLDDSIIEEFDYNGNTEIISEFHFMYNDIHGDREIKYGWDFIEKLRDNKDGYGNKMYLKYLEEYRKYLKK